MPEHYVVVGGGGFLGRAIVEQLLERGDQVTIFDLNKTFQDDRLAGYFVGNICNVNDLDAAFKQKTIVIHTASPIHGKSPELYYKVNVEGTNNIIQACRTNRIKKLIFTSSAGVIYNGQDLINVDESTPYCKVHMDAYNETKALAEVAVLNANGIDGLLTCAIRPSGIFGPRDLQGSKVIVENKAKKIMIGSNDNLFDLTYVDNAAYAHILAADKMTDKNGIGGEAFLITNDQPVFFWDYPLNLYDSLGYTNTQTIVLPKNLGYFLAGISDFICWLISPFKELHPSLTKFRIKIITGNRYFDISKAKTLLGYKPIVCYEEAIKRTAEYWRNEGKAAQ